MGKFAKIFESKKYGQVVCIKQGNDEGIPEVRLFFSPPGLGVCNLATGFKDDSDDSYDLQEEMFDKCSLKTVESMLEPIFAKLGEALLPTITREEGEDL